MIKLINCIRTCFLDFVFFSVIFLSPVIYVDGQETNSNGFGRVVSDNNETIASATVTVVHEPTQNKYVVVTRKDGSFYFFNLKPGGPYSIIISSIGYETLQKTNLYIHLTSKHFLLNDSEFTDFILQKRIVALQEIVINANPGNNKNGIETIITSSTLQSLPTINRGFQDLIRLIPQAKVNAAGAISLAGQNNRFNAFFIDGTNNNDIQGTAANGTNGGQTGAPPVSMEAIEEIQVLLAPYNVQYGNFTGGSINAIIRSGSNENKASAWYYFRNENLAGKSPQPIEKPGFPGEFYRPRLANFFNQTFGAWNSGAIIKNKAFYFVLFEKQSESRPRQFNMSDYRGSSNQQQLFALSDSLQSKYQYDPGSFLEAKDELNITRLNLKFDWNASVTNKFMLSYRYNYAERVTSGVSGTAFVYFHNIAFKVPAKTHTASFEWNHFIKKDKNNRLLITFTNQLDDRKAMGQSFPRVSIADGVGFITFGSDANSAVFDFKASDITLFDAFKFIRKQHVFTIGLDLNYSTLINSSIPNYFGNYQFRNLNDFINGAFPNRLQRSFPLADESNSDHTTGAVKFTAIRTSSFVNDEVRLGTYLTLNFGLRLDIHSMPKKPALDKFFNDTAINIISKYYDLDGASSGKAMKSQWVFSPRIGVEYKLSQYGINIRGGAGIFAGHIVNVWAYNVYDNVTGSIDINPQQYGLNFIADPYNQPTPQSLNIDVSNLKGELNIMAKKFKYPSVFRTTIAVEKNLNNNLTLSIEAILTKNIQEMVFRNVNILPPFARSASPDSRNVYSLNSTTNKIPLRANGTNPYPQVYLITNNHEKKGSSLSLSFIASKQVNGFTFNSSYTYGRSKLLFELMGVNNSIGMQWRNMETINGRNFATPSVSDNDLRHRVVCWVSKKMVYAKTKAATTISLFYNGQSGDPYSYVYNGSMINDNGVRDNFDLIYIPLASELAGDFSTMNFVPITNTSGQLVYSSQQQKQFLNDFIETDKYLRKHRGEFAERNGARLPFTHSIDLRLQQDFKLKIKSKDVHFAIIYDVFNFANMLNKDWGHIYSVVGGNFPLIRFAGYANTTTLTPQYQFSPLNGLPYSLSTNSAPGSSARWISQVGIKININ